MPELVEDLLIKLDKTTFDHDLNDALHKDRRATNYIAADRLDPVSLGAWDGLIHFAAMIFRNDNVYLKRDLTFHDIKPRLLGQSTSGRIR